MYFIHPVNKVHKPQAQYSKVMHQALFEIILVYLGFVNDTIFI